VIAGVGGTLTFAVLALAFAGSFLAVTGSASARTVLITAALAGLVTAMPLWIPAGVLIAAAALMLRHPSEHTSDSPQRRNVSLRTGVHTATPRRGES
jgi:hypothetical protein